jgi:serine/threonine protein kinase
MNVDSKKLMSQTKRKRRSQRSVSLTETADRSVKLKKTPKSEPTNESETSGFDVSPLLSTVSANEADAAADEPEKNVDVKDYDVLSELGTGGMGVVYKAKRHGIENTLAIKMLHPKLVQDAASIKRFEQEAKAASCLTHPHLVSVYEFGFTDKQEPYLVMDFVDGESLAAAIAREHTLAPERCISIFLQVCDALGHAHAKQIIHRDLKPNNIMLARAEGSDSDFVKIVDFGIAKLLPTADTDRERLTQTGELIGSPIYMSPEQCLGHPLDVRSDLYSVGCAMYEALSGSPPFLKNNIVLTILAHLNDPPALLKNVPEELQKIVARCLQKNPAHRYQTIEELKEALEMVHTGTPSARKQLLGRKVAQSQFRSILQRFEKKGFIALAAGTAVIAGAFTFYLQSTADSHMNDYIAKAKLLDLQGQQSRARGLWTKAIAEAEQLHKPKKLIAGLYTKLGDDWNVADPQGLPNAMKFWSVALRDLEEGNCDVIDRIDVLLKMTEQSCIRPYEGGSGQAIGFTAEPTPEELLCLLSEGNPTHEDPDAAAHSTRAKGFLANGNPHQALQELTSVPQPPSRLGELSDICAQLAPKVSPRQAFHYLLVMQLYRPDRNTNELLEKYAAILAGGDKQRAIESIRQMQTELEDHDFCAVSVACREAAVQLDDPMLKTLAHAADKVNESYAVFQKNLDLPPDPSPDEQIALREKLKRLQSEVFFMSWQVETNDLSLAALYMKHGHNAEAEALYKEILRLKQLNSPANLPAPPPGTKIAMQIEPLLCGENHQILVPLTVVLLRQHKFAEAYRYSQDAIQSAWCCGVANDSKVCLHHYWLAIEAAGKAGLNHEARRLAGEVLGNRATHSLEFSNSVERFTSADADFLP